MLALSLAFLGGVDTDPRGRAFEPAPIVHVEAAPSYELHVGVLRFDTGVQLATDFGADLYDADGALDASLRIGDDNLSLAFAGALGMDRTRAAFITVDGVTLPADVPVDGSWTPAARAGTRFHLDMDDVEVAHAWSSTIEAAHDAATLDPIVRSHIAHRVDSDLRTSLALLTEERELQSIDVLLVGSGARHTFGTIERAFVWGGAGIAWDGDSVDARAWSGPSIDASLALDVAGALELALDLGSRTVLARFERRPFGSPFHARATASEASLAITTNLAFLDVGASASGAFIDLADVRDGSDGFRGDALVEVRWPFEMATAIARVAIEACAFGAVRMARAAFTVGVEL